ncbi:right-handed parallel beta-helix repeat-containing protein [Agrilutibacter solisilvae]|uniref:Right-handed parallel beta-helix repeat-containing protein n=1 Tax=Agrilutibacter solisilvae TaxID=2763317 RepID=A0A974XVX9_9GAMM|nr:right-handed parallel beta-helix repeat-containing protein [Lysobacter solisilvae]QSX76917.1 right-handed parallel beta-helix repeat-containing protein [Lysobacter solisilvae]
MTCRLPLPATSLLATTLALACASLPAWAARSYDNCTGFIESLPATLSTPGNWCMRKDLGTAVGSGNAITVAADDVVIDCNDFKLGGMSAGAATTAQGIGAWDRRNITVRNCNIRGFATGVALLGTQGGAHVVEDSRFDGNTSMGLRVEGDASIIRRNVVVRTGGSQAPNKASFASGIETYGRVDVLGNTLRGLVTSDPYHGYTMGIFAGTDVSTVADNHISGLTSRGDGYAIGIFAQGSVLMRRNVVSGAWLPQSTGVYCDSDARIRGSVITGFQTALINCRDDGNTLVEPPPVETPPSP